MRLGLRTCSEKRRLNLQRDSEPRKKVETISVRKEIKQWGGGGGWGQLGEAKSTADSADGLPWA